MTLSTKPEVHNILQSRQKRTEPQPQATGSEKFGKNLTYGSGDNAHRQTQTYKQQNNNKKQQQTLLSQRDRATRYVSQNLFDCNIKSYSKSTTNRSNGVRGLQLIDV